MKTKYRLIETVDSGFISYPFKIQKKYWIGWLTIHSFLRHEKERAEKALDLLIQSNGKRIIK